MGTTATGSKTNIAIFAEGDLSGVVKDLRTEEAAYHLPQVPYSIVPVGLASPDTSGADEWDLDMQYSTGMAGTVAHLYIYDTTSLTDSDIALEFSRFASQDVAKAGSASFGECETFPYLDGSMLADDEVFAEAAAQGQTVFASTGDTGGACANQWRSWQRCAQCGISRVVALCGGRGWHQPIVASGAGHYWERIVPGNAW